MLTLKAIRKTGLYKALMRIPGVELMQIDNELQAVSATTGWLDFESSDLASAFYWPTAPQGLDFWLELSVAQTEAMCA